MIDVCGQFADKIILISDSWVREKHSLYTGSIHGMLTEGSAKLTADIKKFDRILIVKLTVCM